MTESENQDDLELRAFEGFDEIADDEDIPVGEPAIFAEKRGERTISLSVEPSGEPQAKGTKYYVVNTVTGERSYAGKVHTYGSRRGISRASNLLKYNRFEFENEVGAWSHFLWPTVMAESGGRYISINAWDRAHFTWGFYQLAAHTARDNLILLMRELVQLPLCQEYFPDLTLHNSQVAQIVDGKPKTLEREVIVPIGKYKETQIPDFMKYLNPNSRRVDEREVLSAAKFALWAINDPAMRQKTVEVSVDIMKRKLRYRAKMFGLFGKRLELAVWVSDMFHHGRGSRKQVRDALKLNSFDKQLDALSKIDTTGKHDARLKNVKIYVEKLMDEGRFDGQVLGSGDFVL
jgi:hypothetical protein